MGHPPDGSGRSCGACCWGLLHALVVATLRRLRVFLGGGRQYNLVGHWVKGLLALVVNGREHLIALLDLHTIHGVRHNTEFMAY